MDASIIVALIGAVGLVLASILSGATWRVGRGNRKALGEVQTIMAKVVAQSSSQLDERIDLAVRRVFREQPESIASAIIAEALRDLLDGILEAARDDEAARTPVPVVLPPATVEKKRGTEWQT